MINKRSRVIVVSLLGTTQAMSDDPLAAFPSISELEIFSNSGLLMTESRLERCSNIGKRKR